jgi:hypothetical protein
LDTAGLVAALNTGRTAIVPGDLNFVFSPNAAQAAVILAGFDRIVPDKMITIMLPAGILTTVGAADIMQVGINSSKIRLVGAAPAALSMSSVASVTGGAGNWTVTYNVASSSGVAAGDWLKNAEIAPLPILAGDNVVSYVLRNRPVPGELAGEVTNLGRITFVGGTSNVTFAGGGYDTVANVLAAGDLLHCRGQTRQVDTLSINGCTVTSPWDATGALSENSFYTTLPNSGTITCAGTAVTGVGTFFTTEANVGDLLLCDGDIIEIVGIASDTAMTLRKSKTVGSALPYTVLVQAALHNGAHEVLSVGVGTVTVLNKNRPRPPVNRVTGGSMRAIKTVLKHTGTGDGMKFAQHASLPWMEAIAWQGNGGGGVGIAMGGRVPAMPLSASGGSFGSITQNGYTTSAVFGADVAVANWAYNIFLGHGCALNARTIAVSGGTLINIWQMEGSFVNARRAVVSGASGTGQGLNGGSSALITEAQYIGNSGDGLRTEVGASIYGEGPVFIGNQGMNVRVNESGDFYSGGGVSFLSAGSGLYGSNAGASLNDFIIAANRSAGLDCNGFGDYAVNGSWITGNVANNIDNFSANVSAANSNLTGAGNIGAYCALGGTILMTGSYVRGNALGIYADSARIIAISCQAQNATAVGRETTIDLSTPVGPAVTLFGVNRLNEYSAAGSIIRDSNATAFGVSQIKLNGGSSMSFAKHAQLIFDPANLPANEQITFDMTVAGAAPTNMVPGVNSNGLPSGTTIGAHIPAADTVRVAIVNNTAAAINPGNSTWTVAVHGYAA